MDKKLKQGIKQNFIAPPPQRKDEFFSNLAYPKASFCEVLFAQIGFIRKRVWFAFALLLVMAFKSVNDFLLPEDAIPIISAMLPIFSLVAITEIYKSTAYNMAEMELACKYNLSKITLMRLSILGILGIILLFIYVLIASDNDFGLIRNLVYLAVPYLLSSNISLFVIAKFKNKDTVYVCCTLCLGISAGMILLQNTYKFIYSVDYVAIWSISFILLIALLGVNLVIFRKSQEELPWNFA